MGKKRSNISRLGNGAISHCVIALLSLAGGISSNTHKFCAADHKTAATLGILFSVIFGWTAGVIVYGFRKAGKVGK